jgi:hypothetical protein
MRSFSQILPQPDEAKLRAALAQQRVLPGTWPGRPGDMLPVGPPGLEGPPRFTAWSVGIPFPPNLDTYLARAAPSAVDGDDGRPYGAKNDAVARAFAEYFAFDERMAPLAEPTLVAFLHNRARPVAGVGGQLERDPGFPTDWASPAHRVRLAGARGTGAGETGGRVDALFAADLVWLFFHERMGLFRMVGALLDDFVTRGHLLLRNDDWSAYVLETLVRDSKMGLASRRNDRASSFLRVLGWKPPAGEALSGVKVNTAFNEQFHTLVRVALRFYKERQVSETIGSRSTVFSPSSATVTAVRTATVELRNAFEPFEYGRNYVHTLQGVAGVVGALALLRDLRRDLGVPAGLSQPEQYIPLLFDRLLPAEAGSMRQANRYTAHRDCAQAGRDILLDVHFLPEDEGTLRLWLGMMESHFELYRAGYRSLTGVDLGADEQRPIEQAA